MTNNQIAELLTLLGKLLDLHNVESELAKNLSGASFQIDKLNSELAIMPKNNIAKIRGINLEIENFILEILETNQLQILKTWIDKTPIGILQIMQIKGLGPKKVAIIWKEMNIENPTELLYACNENRLIHYKGFGEKLQKTILDATEFFLNSSGKYLFARVKYFSEQLLLYFKKIKNWEAEITGDLRRQNNIIEIVEFVIKGNVKTIAQQLDATYFSEIYFSEDYITCISHQIKVGIYCCNDNEFGTVLFNTTGSSIFINDFKNKYKIPECENENEIFNYNELPNLSPIIREYSVQETMTLPQNNWIQFNDIKGIIHNHSTYSDGVHTLLEMANTCKQNGYEYLVISDHSQYASYANGLKPDKIIEQHKEIDLLNKELHPFKIFKSIECDILPDGNLDYDADVLKTFDLIIASVHSVLNMPEEKAMARLIKAIENPFTNILGHLTGRLLLGRAGYPLNIKKIIDACKENNVVIELNANPRRLDIDWQWIPYAVKQNVLISINPDAHHIDGIQDNLFGVLAAQKGGLLASQNLSSFNLQQFENFIHHQKNKIV